MNIKLGHFFNEYIFRVRKEITHMKKFLNLKNTTNIKPQKNVILFLLINMFTHLYNFSYMFWLHTLRSPLHTTIL